MRVKVAVLIIIFTINYIETRPTFDKIAEVLIDIIDPQQSHNLPQPSPTYHGYPGEYPYSNGGYQTGYYPAPQPYIGNGYPPNGYPPNGYPPNGYPHNGYPHNGYPHNGYPPNGYPHNGYSHNGYPHSGYPQNVYPSGNYDVTRPNPVIGTYPPTTNYNHNYQRPFYD